MQEERKVYQIPRKVTEGFELFKLSGRDMLIMLPVVLFDLWILFGSKLPGEGRIIIVVLTGGTLYMSLSQTLSNGLKIKDYVKLLYRYYLVDQNVYSLISSRSRRKEEPFRQLHYVKPEKKPKEIMVSDWEEFQREPNNEEETQTGSAAELRKIKDAELEELTEWLAKPKKLSN